jgi:probable FeS assembly SUF system protein SufT
MREHTLSRDVEATVIPAGVPARLPAGTRVAVMQSLGGTVTVRTDQGIFRIEGRDAPALEGFVLEEQTASAGAGSFSETAVWDALKTCFDPEIPVNIVDLGLVYDLDVSGPDAARVIEMKMTLTAPGCGMGPVIAEDARRKMAALPGVAGVRVHIVWDPQWTPQMISPAGRKALGLDT